MLTPTSRLLELLEILQAQPLTTGREIAQRLGIDARTVRRYVEALQALDIPVEGQRGVGGGYRIRPGYRLTDAHARRGARAARAVLDAWVIEQIVAWDPGPRLDPLLAAIALFAPVSIVLAAATPIAVRLAARSMERLGRTAGRLFRVHRRQHRRHVRRGLLARARARHRPGARGRRRHAARGRGRLLLAERLLPSRSR